MRLPFTPDQFFEIFALYNQALWPVVVGWWVASIAVLWIARRNPARRSRSLTYLVAALWLWNAVVYHAWLFTRINPAAWLFATLFALEAGLLAWTGVRKRIEYFSLDGLIPRLGAGLVLYALGYSDRSCRSPLL